MNLFEKKCGNTIRPYLSCWKATSVEDVQVIVVLEKRCSHLKKNVIESISSRHMFGDLDTRISLFVVKTFS